MQALATKEVEKVGKVEYSGSIRTLQFLPDQGGDVCEVWLSRFRNVNLYKVQTTNLQTFIFIYKISCGEQTMIMTQASEWLSKFNSM
jgi:hypothetical protein